ncbi:MAG: hypothetical protein NTY14_05530 [Candidatus Omnitrophica bacterium]|nr:hypothetical protein [Candidatus Omnitrophota bacterium]
MKPRSTGFSRFCLGAFVCLLAAGCGPPRDCIFYDKTNNCSLRVPGDWRATQTIYMNAMKLYAPTADQLPFITVGVVVNETQSLEEYTRMLIRDAREKEGWQFLSQEKATLLGQPASRLIFRKPQVQAPPQVFDSLFTIRNGTVYQLTLTVEESRHKENEALFRKIAGSFRIGTQPMFSRDIF